MRFLVSNLAFSAVFVTLASSLSGCMVGPTYHSPDPPITASYTKHPLPSKTIAIAGVGQAGKSQHFINDQDIPAEWWRLFHSTQLNWLINKGLANSPTLAAAEATLLQAKENLTAQVGSILWPSVGASFTAQRQRFNPSSFGGSGLRPSIFNLYNASIPVTYTFDFFGGGRRTIEAYAAQTRYQKYQLDAAYLTLTTNIVTTSVAISSLRAQIEATRQIITAQENELNIMRKQLKLGAISGLDVLAIEAQLEQIKATLPPLQQLLAKNVHALAVLVGEFPSESDIPMFDWRAFTLPKNLPVSLPSQLVRQRPDIRAAEALLHVASAQVGIATANMYPQITITGSYGWQGLALSSLFKPSTIVWNVASGITQPLFNGGALIAQKRAAIAGYKIAEAQYRQTVLQAFQNVADSLRALENDAKTLRALMHSEVAANKTLKIVWQQYKDGNQSYIAMLTAQRQYQQARIDRIRAQAARYSDTAALFQAMGGGWWDCRC